MIIATPNGGPIGVYHLGPNDSPVVFNKGLLPNKDFLIRAYPTGTVAVVCGGDNTPSSNFVLSLVVKYLEANMESFTYSNTAGVNIDSNGKFFLYVIDSGTPTGGIPTGGGGK